MNEGIRYSKICDRLQRHATENMEELDFMYIFPDVYYNIRYDSPDLAHIGCWFHVEHNRITQLSSYGNTPDNVLVLVEPILFFPDHSATSV